MFINNFSEREEKAAFQWNLQCEGLANNNKDGKNLWDPT